MTCFLGIDSFLVRFPRITYSLVVRKKLLEKTIFHGYWKGYSINFVKSGVHVTTRKDQVIFLISWPLSLEHLFDQAV